MDSHGHCTFARVTEASVIMGDMRRNARSQMLVLSVRARLILHKPFHQSTYNWSFSDIVLGTDRGRGWSRDKLEHDMIVGCACVVCTCLPERVKRKLVLNTPCDNRRILESDFIYLLISIMSALLSTSTPGSHRTGRRVGTLPEHIYRKSPIELAEQPEPVAERAVGKSTLYIVLGSVHHSSSCYLQLTDDDNAPVLGPTAITRRRLSLSSK